MRLTVLLLPLALVLAGCAAPSDAPGTPTPSTAGGSATTPAVASPTPDASCPTPAQKRAAFDGATAFLESLEGHRLVATLEGTLEGEVGTITIAADPENHRLHFASTADESDVRVDGTNYSVSTTEATGHGRHLKPGAIFATFYGALLEGAGDDPTGGVSFAADKGVDDYEARCLTLGGVDAIEFGYEGENETETIVVEADGLHRPLSMRIVDPPLKDDYRAKFSYDAPTIRVQTSLPRLPPTLAFDVVDTYTNDRDGLYLSARFNDDAHWVDLDDVSIELVDDEGSVYYEAPLRDGDYDMEDGDFFQFRDRDDNGLLSTGDTFVMDVGPGLDVAFFDAWSREYADMIGS